MMQKTAYYIDGSGYIQGPQNSGQYNVNGGFIYGSSGKIVGKVNGDGSICEEDGRATGFQIIGTEIWGPSNNLPWF